MGQNGRQALALAAMSERTTTELLVAAAAGDAGAWNVIVARYERLVWSVVRGFRFDGATAADVAQTVWLKLVENLDRIRHPERLPSWLATTARNEALRTVRTQQRMIPSDFEFDLVDDALPEVDAAMLEDEQLAALVAAFGELSEECRRLLRLLTTDPPLDYDTISELTGRPKGSIGPTRGRCVNRLRRIMQRHEGVAPPDDEGPDI